MYIADLHIHSKYSRATSKNGDIPHLDLWARRKGIGLVGTGDFTHPAWREEMAEALEPAEAGLYRIREENRIRDFCDFSTSPRFVVSGEISCIYKQDGKVRKVHNVILLPSLDAAERLALKLETIGNIRSDGRPILGLSSKICWRSLWRFVRMPSLFPPIFGRRTFPCSAPFRVSTRWRNVSGICPRRFALWKRGFLPIP